MKSKEELEKINQYPKFLSLRVSALFEILGFFIVMFAISILFKIPFNYIKTPLHPFWIVIILISSQYGINEGLFVAIISSIIYFLGPFPLETFAHDSFDYFFSLIKLPMLWLVTAVILGELRSKHIRERNSLKEEAIKAIEKAETISESYEGLKKIKENLEVRVVSEMQTALMAYSSFRRLEEMNDKMEIIKGALDLVKTLIAPEKCSIYLLKENKLELVSSYGWAEKELFSTSFPSESELFQEITINPRVLSIINSKDATILGLEGILVVPIIDIDSDRGSLGMIKIEEIPFTRLRVTTIETLRTIGEWVGAAYSNFLTRKGGTSGS